MSLEKERLKAYYEFYVSTIKEYKIRFKNLLEGFSCFEVLQGQVRKYGGNVQNVVKDMKKESIKK